MKKFYWIAALMLALGWAAGVAQAIDVAIVNPDFEDTTVVYPNASGPEGWTVNNGGIGVFDAPAAIEPTPNGSQYVCLFNVTAPLPINMIMYQYVPHVIQAGYTYQFSIDINNGVDLSESALPYWTSFSVQLWSDPGTVDKEQMCVRSVTHADFTAPNQWQTFNLEYTDNGTFAGRTMFVQFQVIGGIQPFLDNVRITEYVKKFSVTPDQVEIFENSLTGPTTADFSVVLDAMPGAPVTVNMTCEPNITVTPSLTFDDTNWYVPQTATVTALDFDVWTKTTREHIVTFKTDSTDAAFDEQYNYRSVIVYNDDVPATLVDVGDGLAVSEEGPTSDSYTIRLLSPPTDPVIVNAVDSDPCGVTTDTPVTFTVAQWYETKTINVTAVDDALSEGDPHSSTVSHSLTSDDTGYDGLTVDSVDVTIQDNDCGSWGYGIRDYNQDCIVDVIDFSFFSNSWLNCSTPYQPGCEKP